MSEHSAGSYPVGEGGLADRYVSDPRYLASYDEIEPGFSQYVHDAITASAGRPA